ncbi:MAG: DUF1800 domain-containing protein [Bacteroidota bacterium]
MNKRNIQHLYSRAGFGILPHELGSRENWSRDKVVEHLFAVTRNVTPLRIDLSEIINLEVPEGEKRGRTFIKKGRDLLKDYNRAWIDRLMDPSSGIHEKMILFWANVFVAKDKNIIHTQQYNNTLRKYALGDFREFVKAVSKAPTMMKYLNTNRNVKKSPNENFARELLELFTLGVGNYTEKDIKEAARAFTGWSFKEGSFHLNQRRHDSGKKEFLGKSGNFDGDDIIDIILDQRQCARFICSKIYRYFVNPDIDEERLEELTHIFYGDYDIGKLMQYLFKTDWFYNSKNIGVKIKSPIELLAGINRVVPLQFKKENQIVFIQKMMGQHLLHPPNVAGWKGDRYWIDTNTLMFRLNLPAMLLNNAILELVEKGGFKDSFAEFYDDKKKKGRTLDVHKSWDIFERNYGHLGFQEFVDTLIPASVETKALEGLLKKEDKKTDCIRLMSLPEYQLC